MGRQVRRVPGNWQHPRNESGKFIPLFDGAKYEEDTKYWDESFAKWSEGDNSPVDHYDRPRAEHYMPRWTASEATHLMMYEDTSEGTPISPAFATPEELARWLVDNRASACGKMIADYDHWLRVARGGYAPGLVIADGCMYSGVQGMPLTE